jgi:uncharacterized protein DUF4407
VTPWLLPPKLWPLPELSNGLLRLSGARLDILERTPLDRAKFIGIGASLLTSGAAATVSMYYALHIAVQTPPPLAIIFALLWGLTVLALNRWLVISLPRPERWSQFLYIIAPRILLSALLATIISVPLLLQIFATEVSAEIPMIQHAQLNSFLVQQRESPLAKKIATDQSLVGKLQASIAAGGITDPYANDIVSNLQAQVRELQNQEVSDYEKWQCELYGGGGDCHAGTSSLSGNGPLTEEDKSIYENDVSQLSLVQSQLSQALKKATQESQANRGSTVATARAELPAAQATLRHDQQVQTTALASFDQSNTGTGLLIELRALSAASSGNTQLAWARVVLFLLFLLIDSMPVIARVLVQLGPPSTYDRMLTMDESLRRSVARQRDQALLLEADKLIASTTAQLAAEAERRLRERRDLDAIDRPNDEAELRGYSEALREIEQLRSELQMMLGNPLTSVRSGPTHWPSSTRAVTGRGRRSDRPQNQDQLGALAGLLGGGHVRGTPEPPVLGTPPVPATPLTPFTETSMPHADGQLRRLDISEGEFLLIDSLDGVPTLNWTAEIGAREFASIAGERLGPVDWNDTDDAGSPQIMLSMAGIADRFSARLGVEIAALSSPTFDERSEFVRFDDDEVTLALQSLHADDDSHVKIFGVISSELDLDAVLSLMTRTATPKLADHARQPSVSPLVKRLAEIARLPVAVGTHGTMGS